MENQGIPESDPLYSQMRAQIGADLSQQMRSLLGRQYSTYSAYNHDQAVLPVVSQLAAPSIQSRLSPQPHPIRPTRSSSSRSSSHGQKIRLRRSQHDQLEHGHDPSLHDLFTHPSHRTAELPSPIRSHCPAVAPPRSPQPSVNSIASRPTPPNSPSGARRKLRRRPTKKEQNRAAQDASRRFSDGCLRIRCPSRLLAEPARRWGTAGRPRPWRAVSGSASRSGIAQSDIRRPFLPHLVARRLFLFFCRAQPSFPSCPGPLLPE